MARFVCLEGIDGSGKGTQTGLLAAALRKTFRYVETTSFPNYESFFGRMIGEYLKDGYGPAVGIHPKLAATLYACDRLVNLDDLKTQLLRSEIFICDRYIYSNLGHQAAKLPVSAQWDFAKWLFELEFNVFTLPKPDLLIYLKIDVESAVQNVAKKAKRIYTDSSDSHESDRVYLQSVKRVYEEVLPNALKEWNAQTVLKVVDCNAPDGSLRDLSEIHQEVLSVVQKCVITR